MKKEITVVIQGPIDERTYEAVDAYQGFGEVIVSTWDNEDISLLNKSSGVYKLVQSSYDDGWKENYNNHGYRYFQSTTVNAGVKAAKTKYCMKTRSDELFPNLERMISNLEFYPNRLHTTNIGFWRPDSRMKMEACFSTHVYIAPTEQLVEASTNALAHCKRQSYTNIELQCTEQLYGYFLMLSRGIDLLSTDWKEAFRNNVFITPCSELPGHLHSGCANLNNHFTHKRRTDYPYGRLDPHPLEELYIHHSQII